MAVTFLDGATDHANFNAILSPAANSFLASLATRFTPRLEQLLENRKDVQASIDAGAKLHFLAETKHIREDPTWQVSPLPADLQDRRVEITGPVERKMVINALNSGATTFMADFEDSNTPTWHNQLDGQQNLYDAIRRTIAFEDPRSGKTYQLQPKVAVLLVRPRGWHLPEAHVRVDGLPVPAALFDFGLYLFHNAKELLARGSGPYFYLPKMQHHLEARLWNDVFLYAQQKLSLPRGTIKATVLIETLPAAFQMEEILWELREHSAGLNCGRWDYIFSFIKTQRASPQAIMPDRGLITMAAPCMRAYSQLLVQTTHRRGVHGIGGMAAQIPIKGDKAANDAAMTKVRADKEREVRDGHDGTWVAHPALVPLAKEVFDAGMASPNQISNKQTDVKITEADLLAVPQGPRTEGTLRTNCRVGVQYLEAWLRGSGCVPIDNLMEDAATAEICRTQVWQWLHHGVEVGGSPLTPDRFARVLQEEAAALKQAVGEERWGRGKYVQALALFERFSTSETLEDFLTLEAYRQIIAEERASMARL